MLIGVIQYREYLENIGKTFCSMYIYIYRSKHFNFLDTNPSSAFNYKYNSVTCAPTLPLDDTQYLH